MNKKLLTLAILIAFIFITGCAKVPISINRYELLSPDKKIRSFQKNDETYYCFENNNYKITAILFEAQSIFIAQLEINNKTKSDLKANGYSIALYDGRDFKKIKMLDRNDLVTFKATLNGGPPSNNIEQQLIDSALNALMAVTNTSSKDFIIKGLDTAIDNYYAFRPIYAREKREGILCFFSDFKLEYPLTLKIKLKKEEIKLRFVPKGGIKNE